MIVLIKMFYLILYWIKFMEIDILFEDYIGFIYAFFGVIFKYLK